VSAHSTSEIAAATRYDFPSPPYEDLSRFPYCPFWDMSHVMFIPLLFCSYYLTNRYFPRSTSTSDAPAYSFLFFLTASTTDLLQDSSANSDPTSYGRLAATISHARPNDDLEAGPSWREVESEVEDILERVFAVWCVLLSASLADQIL